MKQSGIICFLFFLLFSAALPAGWLRVPDSRAGTAPLFDPDRFIAPETCGGCHAEIMAQWEGSMHSLSHKDPVYTRTAKFLREGLSDQGEVKEAESCVKCHTPVGYVTGFPQKLSDDLSKTPGIATLGIQCDYCHSAVKVEEMFNNGLVLEPGEGEDDPGTKWGPFDDCEPDYHDTAFSALHTSAEICGTCHNVKHVAFGTDLETTYTEWLESPYNSDDPNKRITCQGCHMYQRPGIPATGSTGRPENPGSATDYTKERPHIFTHYFVGGNTHVPRLFEGADKADMAEERLKHAATLSLDLSGLDQGKLGISVTNTGAGHHIPTGVGDLRQVWLAVTIKNPAGRVVFRTGALDPNNELSADTIIFKTTFGDGKGNPVLNLAKARQVISDTRIPAQSTVTRTIEFGAPLEKNSDIRVQLLYRGMPQKLLNLLPPPKPGPLPVVEMAAVSHRVSGSGKK